jgi:hypothetical protein
VSTGEGEPSIVFSYQCSFVRSYSFLRTLIRIYATSETWDNDYIIFKKNALNVLFIDMIQAGYYFLTHQCTWAKYHFRYFYNRTFKCVNHSHWYFYYYGTFSSIFPCTVLPATLRWTNSLPLIGPSDDSVADCP